MHPNIVSVEPNLNGEGLRIGVVMSRFNQPVCEGLRNACLAELIELGVDPADIILVTVPGALEIPLALQTLVQSDDDEFDALIALGAVIRGDTYHFELVANESGRGVSEIGLEFDIPVANAILTTDTDEQALSRMVEKGRASAHVAVEMANLQKSFIE